jgi:hypothetical protein
MYCPSCGVLNSTESRQCSSCGAYLPDMAPRIPAPKIPAIRLIALSKAPPI